MAHRIDGPGHASNLFTEGNPAGGVPATTVTDDWLNDAQEEICNLIEAAGLTLVKGNQDQLREAIYYLAGEVSAQGVNLLVNSSFDWWERWAQPRAGINSNGYEGPDRWYIRPGTGGGIVTLTKDEISPFASGPEVGGSGRHLKWDQTTGGTEPELSQRIEELNTLDGRTVVFSFWAKCDSGTVVCTPRVRQFWGSTGSGETETDYATITVTTSWQRFNVVLAVPSGSGKTATGTGQHTAFGLVFPDATTFGLSFGWPQVSIGPYAAPYHRPQASLEFLRVQRYYRKSYGPSNNPGDVTDGGVVAGMHNGVQRDIRGLQQFLGLPMRTNPTVRWYSPRTGTINRIEDPVASTDYVVSQTRWANRVSSGVPQLSTQPGAVHMQAHLTLEAEL